MLKKTLLATGLLGLVLSASQPAFAKTSVVSYADLNLASKEDQAKLDKRLRHAARRVCDLTSPNLSRSEFASAQACFLKSYAQAKQARTGVVQTAMASAR